MAMRHSLSTDKCFLFDGLLVQIDLFNNEIEVFSRFSCKRNRARNSILDRLQPFTSRIGAAWLATGGAEDRQSTIGLIVFPTLPKTTSKTQVQTVQNHDTDRCWKRGRVLKLAEGEWVGGRVGGFDCPCS